MGPSYCSFGCTHCYLPTNANSVPRPPLREMRRLIDANRELLGPGGALQVTGGDVVDAYLREGHPEELVEVIRYAVERELVPMIMTHGHSLLEHPELLDALVRAGLSKLAIHIDMTQAGRPGYPIKSVARESDLHPLRDRFVELIRSTRRRTGRPLSAAHTMTITRNNLDYIPEVVEWLTRRRENLDAFRMLSLQTEADVGRTRFSSTPVTAQESWARVAHAVGADLPRETLRFGHPDCSSMMTLAVVFPEGRFIRLSDDTEPSRLFWADLLRTFGGLGTRSTRTLEENLRRLALLARRPSLVWSGLRFAADRVYRERIGPTTLWRALTGRVGGLSIVMHNFMSRDALQHPQSAEVRDRLAACSFRGAVKKDGEWTALPMCSMNIDERETHYRTRIARD